MIDPNELRNRISRQSSIILSNFVDAPKLINKALDNDIEKALVKKMITDKNGKVTTVWVNPAEPNKVVKVGENKEENENTRVGAVAATRFSDKTTADKAAKGSKGSAVQVKNGDYVVKYSDGTDLGNYKETESKKEDKGVKSAQEELQKKALRLRKELDAKEAKKEDKSIGKTESGKDIYLSTSHGEHKKKDYTDWDYADHNQAQTFFRMKKNASDEGAMKDAYNDNETYHSQSKRDKYKSKQKEEDGEEYDDYLDSVHDELTTDAGDDEKMEDAIEKLIDEGYADGSKAKEVAKKIDDLYNKSKESKKEETKESKGKTEKYKDGYEFTNKEGRPAQINGTRDGLYKVDITAKDGSVSTVDMSDSQISDIKSIKEPKKVKISKFVTKDGVYGTMKDGIQFSIDINGKSVTGAF